MNALEHRWRVWNKPSVLTSIRIRILRVYLHLTLETENRLVIYENLIITSRTVRGFRTANF